MAENPRFARHVFFPVTRHRAPARILPQVDASIRVYPVVTTTAATKRSSGSGDCHPAHNPRSWRISTGSGYRDIQFCVRSHQTSKLSSCIPRYSIFASVGTRGGGGGGGASSGFDFDAAITSPFGRLRHRKRKVFDQPASVEKWQNQGSRRCRRRYDVPRRRHTRFFSPGRATTTASTDCKAALIICFGLSPGS